MNPESDTQDFFIDANPETGDAKIEGILRLQNPMAYEEPFSKITNLIHSDLPNISINLTQLEFLNSSGVSSFARIILMSKKNQKNIELLCKQSIPWQRKTIGSLVKLNENLKISFVD